MTTIDRTMGATLPEIRGPLSAAVVDTLAGGRRDDFDLDAVLGADPFGEDLQLALHVCYELHYQGFAEVDDGWEWDPRLLGFRAALEKTFLEGIRAAVPGGDDVGALLDELLIEPVDSEGVSHFLRDEGEWWHVEEYFAHRSIYHLKEADPHVWVIPRLRGRAKAALVAVEFDEFGGGRADQAHSRLFSDLLTGAGLSPGYLAYLDHVPARTLATVNMMSLFGLHRGLRGALVGHFAVTEITTGPSARRMDEALGRLGGAAECRHFYTEHIEADAVHEQVLRHDVVGDLLEREPELAADIVLGIQATDLLENRLTEHLLGAWSAGETSLLRPVRPLP
ncbi:iron-containing redox enzyme family protein [Amycolatopsis speibonae]|uniref:Iron-containing redox enzyme family protein n=1 Tax=Amycolatopsis speibonae TaxID=1450224 RepID=A0ABV7PBG3_9PSEU